MNISVLLSLLHCKILDEGAEYNLNFKAEQYLVNSTLISKDDFLKIEFWFEKDLSTSLKTGKIVL